ncbi:MAG: aminotransferase class IV [Bacteroidales bacterium]|jgi:4-amino-4-deoxychorismate lyase|nr:aminotransferase class IV [Bacteroidales bacterium]
MYRLVETIRSEDGVLNNLVFHNERMIRTLSDLYGLKISVDLGDIITIPDSALRGLFKCRVEYDSEIRKIEFVPYTMKSVRTLKTIESNTIDYSYKYADRNDIDLLMERREECDDILIIKNGFITDTSYANVILLDKEGRWNTPSTFLLPGTRRASLIKMGIITEKEIKIHDIIHFTEVRLINAMIGINDTESIPVNNLR